MALTLLSEAVCDRMKSNNASGAQTERRGDAGPVRGLLGGKDRTGRFYWLSRTVCKTVLILALRRTRQLPRLFAEVPDHLAD
jgi:hypothetical protein